VFGAAGVFRAGVFQRVVDGCHRGLLESLQICDKVV
jgi:hypothetical protein